MFVRAFLLMCCVMVLTGCPHALNTKSSQASPPSKIQQVRQPSIFTQVIVHGKLNINLRTGFTHPRLILRGNPTDLSQIITTVTNGTLHITCSKGYPKLGPVNIDINSQYLNAFEYHGTGQITGTQLHTSLLDLILDNQGPTTLRGQIGLHKLSITGNGYTEITGIHSPSMMVKLSGKSKVRLGGLVNLSSLEIAKESALTLYWVKSRVLTIRGKNKALIQLAGIVELLDVELWGTSQFKGRYLRADRAFVKTHGHAIAEISATKRQHTLAKDNSDIQFFNIPVMKTDFMAKDGAVLDMRDLAPPFVQEYNQYNK